MNYYVLESQYPRRGYEFFMIDYVISSNLLFQKSFTKYAENKGRI